MKASNLDAEAKAGLELELGEKIEQFQSALKDLLGLDLAAFTTGGGGEQVGPGGPPADETARSVFPGEEFRVRVHTANATGNAQLTRVWIESHSGSPWKAEDTGGAIAPQGPIPVIDRLFRVQVAEDAVPTAPFFTRPSTEQPYYDISNPEWRVRSFAPWPLAAWAEFNFDGVPIRLGQVVQTLRRVTGPGGIYEPLVVTPAIGVRMEPEARILPLDGSALPVKVTVSFAGRGRGNRDSQAAPGLARDPGRGSIPAQVRRRYRAAGVFRYHRRSCGWRLQRAGDCALWRTRLPDRLAEHRLRRPAALQPVPARGAQDAQSGCKARAGAKAWAT